MQNEEPLIPASQSQGSVNRKSGIWQMWLIVIIFAAPVVASYTSFYWLKPAGGKTNYGQLIYPVQTAPEDSLKPIVYGKWTLLLARPAGTCVSDEEHCVKVLFFIRQLRASLGKEIGRVQIIWVNSDNSQVSQELQNAYDEKVAGVKIFSVPEDAVRKKQFFEWLNQDGHQDNIQLLDPTGSRMMIFPSNVEELNFKKMQKDLNTLLKWNPTGKYGS
jgi:hypothetical protein